jgi:hypothetical protein
MLKSIAFSVFVAFMLSLSFVSAQQTPAIHHRFGGIVTSDLTEFYFRFSVMVDKSPQILTTVQFANKIAVSSAKSSTISSIQTEYYMLRNETYTASEIVDYEYRETIREYITIDEKNGTKEAIPDGCVALSERELSCFLTTPIYKDVTKTRAVYELFDVRNGLTPDIWYDFLVKTTKRAETGRTAIDVIPSVMGYDLPYAWWNSSFSGCRNITFNSYQIGANLTDFPAIVVLDNSAGAFAAAQADWDDVRFIDGACNMPGGELYFELENFTTKNATFFVQVNLTTPQNKKISVYYGSLNASTKSNPDAVWAGYSLVIHGNQTATGTTPDSSPNHAKATTMNMESSDVGRAGRIDGALNMDGFDEFVNVSDSTSLNFGDTMDFSWEAWAYPRGIAGNTIIIKQKDATHNEGYYMRFDATTNYARCGIDSTPFVDTADAVYHTNSWTYIVCAAKRDGNMSMFVNGVLIANSSITGVATVNNTNSLYIGIGRDVSTYPHIGLLDEVRIYKGTKSPAWINATYINGLNPMAFFVLGEPENESFPVVFIPPNVTYTWDLGTELPVISKYCSSDGFSLVTNRGRYAYTASGEPFSINQTDIQTCQYGCADAILTNFGYPGCKESNLLYAIIFIVVTIGVVILVRFISGRGG